MVACSVSYKYWLNFKPELAVINILVSLVICSYHSPFRLNKVRSRTPARLMLSLLERPCRKEYCIALELTFSHATDRSQDKKFTGH